MARGARRSRARPSPRPRPRRRGGARPATRLGPWKQGSWPGSRSTVATCPGARLGIRTRSSSLRSCSSRRRSSASSRAHSPGSSAGRPSRPSPARRSRRHPRMAGLGYNRRAVNLHRAAQRIAETGWPEDLTELPGVGRYTADAVGCVRLRPVGPPRGRERIAASSSAPAASSARCAQALMDLGATVCLARVPRCGACPLAEVPVARAAAMSRSASRAGSRARSGSAARRTCGWWPTGPRPLRARRRGGGGSRARRPRPSRRRPLRCPRCRAIRGRVAPPDRRSAPGASRRSGPRRARGARRDPHPEVAVQCGGLNVLEAAETKEHQEC